MADIRRTVWAACLAGLGLGWWSGCAAPSVQNRQVYDRYAALVAERNRTGGVPAAGKASAPATPAAAAESRPAASATGAKNDQPATAKSAPPPASPTPPPVQVISPKPAAKPEVPPATPPVAAPPVAAAPIPVAKPAVPQAPPPIQPTAPAAAPFVATAPAPAAGPAPSPPAAAEGMAYLLKAGDVVQITLRGIPAGEAIEDVIDENGMVSLPFVNDVRAAGMTSSELERSIRQIYLDQDIYRNIGVSVVVPTRYYFIQGEVNSRGKFQLVTATRLSQAIAAAGGYTEFASGQVVIKRGGKIYKTVRNARKLERTPGDDILLEPDDVIEVRRSLW